MDKILEETEKELGYNKMRWLYAHGGRTIKDVLYAGKKTYILMGTANGKDERLFIPCDETIIEYFTN